MASANHFPSSSVRPVVEIFVPALSAETISYLVVEPVILFVESSGNEARFAPPLVAPPTIAVAQTFHTSWDEAHRRLAAGR